MDIQSVSTVYGSKMYNMKSMSKKSVAAQEKHNINEKVEISDYSSKLQNLKEIVDKTPEIRIKIVREIKARIETNDYPLENNLDEVVKTMIQNRILEP